MLELYAHPFASYCQKALIALYENDTPFEFRMVAPDDDATMTELGALWPFRKFPVLVDGEKTVIEASIIVEHIAVHHPGPRRLIPQDAADALEVRFMDRFFDNYVATPQGSIVFNAIRDGKDRDPVGDDHARAMLDTAYRWLDDRMQGRAWAAGDHFSLADCAAAPSLFYADWTHAIPDRLTNVHAYRERLLERPSFARCLEEARPYRKLFPLGAPDRD